MNKKTSFGISFLSFTRYRNITTKIDHERILPLYDSDAQDELDCVREPFVNRLYFAPDKHKTLLQRLRKQIIKKTNKITLPATVMRVARNFKRQRPSQQQQQQQQQHQQQQTAEETVTTLAWMENLNCYVIHWKLLNEITVNVISHLLQSDFICPIYYALQ